MRVRTLFISAGLAGGLLTAACQSDTTTGPNDMPSPSMGRNAAGSGQVATDWENADPSTGLHLVVFRGNRVPNGFARAVEALGGSVADAHGRFGFATVSGLDDAGAAALLGRRDVMYVEADQLIDLGVPAYSAAMSAPGASVDGTYDPTGAFFYARQWHYPAISADVAWAGGYLGSPDVTVAILDTGIDYMYPDLYGLVDLSRSASFIPFDDALVDTYFPGRNHVTDLFFHGTHVANTVASHANVVAGVTSKTTLIGVKVCSVLGSCPTSAVLNGIIFATDNGADIINMSLGGLFSKRMYPGFVSVINNVTSYARRMGTLIVVSAGNAGADLDHNGNTFASYCDSSNVVCVSATGPTAAAGVNGPWTDVDAPTGYTNYGRSAINVAAPGGTFLPASNGGWVWQACSGTSLLIPICQTGTFIVGVTGTSMSSPHAAGVAALIAASSGGAPSQIKAGLQQSADDLGQPGTDPFYGKGRINAAAAIGAD